MGKLRDPLIAPRFMVKFGGKLAGSFRECTVVSSEHEPVEYKFADQNGAPGYYAIPGRMKPGRITLKRGLTDDLAIWNWRHEVENGNVDKARTNGSIIMLNQDGKAVAEYNFFNAWPLKVSGPAPNANSNEIAMEEVEIICESVRRVS